VQGNKEMGLESLSREVPLYKVPPPPPKVRSQIQKVKKLNARKACTHAFTVISHSTSDSLSVPSRVCVHLAHPLRLLHPSAKDLATALRRFPPLPEEIKEEGRPREELSEAPKVEVTKVVD